MHLSAWSLGQACMAIGCRCQPAVRAQSEPMAAGSARRQPEDVRVLSLQSGPQPAMR